MNNHETGTNRDERSRTAAARSAVVTYLGLQRDADAVSIVACMTLFVGSMSVEFFQSARHYGASVWLSLLVALVGGFVVSHMYGNVDRWIHIDGVSSKPDPMSVVWRVVTVLLAFAVIDTYLPHTPWYAAIPISAVGSVVALLVVRAVVTSRLARRRSQSELVE